jgi:hypothetical protein
MNDPMLPLPGLSPVSGKTIVAKFDGGLLSSDGGILVLREVEQRLRVADRMAACIKYPRAPDQITHTLADIIRFRLLMIAAGYEDGNDASSLRGDPMFKMALDLMPSDRELCSQSTISRLENLPDARALLRMGRAMVDLYCESFQRVPKRITLDIDDTFDAVHGGQQLRLFNAYYDEYGFQPIVVFDGEGRFVTAVLRPAKRPSGKEVRAFLRRLLRAIRANWPKTEILLRADSHYCSPEVLDWCLANGLDYILGVAPTTTLRRHIGDIEASTKARFEAAPKEGKARRFKEFFDGAASWSRVERIVARVEAGAEGPDTREDNPQTSVFLIIFFVLSLLINTFGLNTVAVGKAYYREAQAARAADTNTTAGQCSPIVTSNRAAVTIECKGMSEQPQKQLVDILNSILQKQLDPAAVMAKLDDIASGAGELKSKSIDAERCLPANSTVGGD